MPTTFDVIYLGVLADIDTVEGDPDAENAAALTGLTLGSSGDPLFDHIQSFSPGTTGFGLGTAGAYDPDTTDDTFSIDGGADQTFDMAMLYNATISYADGSTGSAVVILAQDDAGNTYLVPWTSFTSDQAALEAGLIESITLGSTVPGANNGYGLTGDRYDGNFLGSVDGTSTGEVMGVGYTDADGDQITDDADSIAGNGGNDTISAGGGNDTIDGGEDNDSISGDDGADVIQGGSGNDSIDGGAGGDTIYGDAPKTTVIGDDFTSGWSGSATLDSTRATVTTDNAWTNAKTTTPTGMSSGDGAGGGAQLTLDFVWSDGNPSASSGSADFYIDYDGINYVQITTPVDGSAATITYNNGASGPAGPIAEGDVIAGTGYTTLTFDLPPGIADSGELEFWADTTGSATDDFAIDNVIVTRDGHFTAGNDTINGGSGDDTIYGGDGDDTFVVTDGFGDDTITGGELGETAGDTIDLSAVTVPITVTYTGDEAGTITDGTDTITFSETENLILTDQNDIVDASVTRNGLIGDEPGVSVDGRGGDDTITGGRGADTIEGGTGADSIVGDYGDDILSGGAGNDTIYGDDIADGENGNDTIDGGAGDDFIYGGAQSDSLSGGVGNDTLDGGAGADNLTGGDGADVFIADGTADTITDFDTTTGIDGGGSGDNDFVDLTGFYNQTNLDAWNAANPGQTYTTPLGWLRADQADGTLGEAGNLVIESSNIAVAGSELNAENTGVVCFVEGTSIKTIRGDIPVEDLKTGDMVLTAAGSYEPIIWRDHTAITTAQQKAAPNLRPVRIKPGTMGNDEALFVSQQHCMVVHMNGKSRFMRAKHLAEYTTRAHVVKAKKDVIYHHILLPEHAVIYADGAACESFYPGLQSVTMLAAPSLEALTKAVAPLAGQSLTDAYGPPRLPSLRRHDIHKHIDLLWFDAMSHAVPLVPIEPKRVMCAVG